MKAISALCILSLIFFSRADKGFDLSDDGEVRFD